MTEGSAAAVLRQYLAVIRRQAWVIILLTVACAAAAVFVSTRQDPVYRASTKIVVGQGRALFGPDVSFAVEPFTQTMTELLQSDVVAGRVIREQNLSINATELLDRVEITSKPDTSVLEVTYDDTDKGRAVRVLGELAASFTQLIDEGLGGGRTATPTPSASDATSAEPVSATVFDPAHLEPGQVSPKPVRTLVIATIVGLIVGLAVAFLRDLLASRVRDQAEAEAAFGAPVVGVLPRGTVGSNPAELELLASKSAGRVRQSFEMLSATMRFSLKSENLSVILVTSGMPEEGKTTVAANLAFALARSGRRVVVVEGDTRRPALHAFFGHPPAGLGMLDVVSGAASLDHALVDIPLSLREPAEPDLGRRRGARSATTALEPPAEAGELLLLPAGHKGQGVPPILSVSQAATMIANLREYADCIVFDSAPLLLAGDAFPFAQLANEVLVVCRERASSRRQAERVRSRLRSIGVEEFSVVLTEATAAAEPTYDYSY